MLTSHRNCFLIALAALLIAGCEEAPQPVGGIAVEPTQIALPASSYTPLEITVTPSTALDAGADPHVMVHLLDASGTVVRTFDHPLPVEWTPGTTESYPIDLYQSALAPPLDAGAYRLTVGLYDPAAGRWALTAAGEEVATSEYAVATVDAAPRPEAGPRFFFSPTWQATEAGTDVQILGRRWLRGDGSIRVDRLESAGTLKVVARIPKPNPELEDLVLSEGFDGVVLEATTTCSDQSWTFTGQGRHVLEVSVGAGAGECEIAFVPRYQIVNRLNLDGRALVVDLLAWQPAG